MTAALFILMKNRKDGQEKTISWQEFQVEYLRRGLVQSIQVVNGNLAVAQVGRDTGDLVDLQTSDTGRQSGSVQVSHLYCSFLSEG